MKRLFALIISTAILAAMAVPAFAQRRSRSCDSRTYSSRTYSSRTYYDNRAYYDNSGYYDNRSYYDYNYRNRSFWNRHRDKLTVAIGTGAGAAIGAMTGGKKGAAIGALVGGGGAAVYTYGVLLAASYLLGLRLAMSRAKARGLDASRVLDLAASGWQSSFRTTRGEILDRQSVGCRW